jgi:transcriptional regulator with XRE-family HTH domain
MNKALKVRIIEIFDTQADFAQALGVDESYISRVIRGRRMLDSASQNRWAKLLKCKSETIFGNEKLKSG